MSIYVNIYIYIYKRCIMESICKFLRVQPSLHGPSAPSVPRILRAPRPHRPRQHSDGDQLLWCLGMEAGHQAPEGARDVAKKPARGED